MTEEKHILIVDDSEEDVVFLSEILEEHGYTYRVARNGQEAMAAMRESPPKLVLLDIMMPRKGGIAVFKETKRDEELRNIPIIIITGASEASGVDMKTGQEMSKETEADVFLRRMGAHLHEDLKAIRPDGFIEKPIDPPLLVQKIKVLLS